MTRGHGSGRAPTPKAEAARREKIRAAAFKREAKFRAGPERFKIAVSAAWISKSRSTRRGQKGYRGTLGWSYNDGTEGTYLMTSDDAEDIRRELNRRHPTRQYYNVRVMENGDEE
jgi:hypothetical protein